MRSLLRATLWLLAVVMVLRYAASDGGRLQSALPDADAILTYPLDNAVRFALEPGERKIRLTTWLEGPRPEWRGDPRVEQRWCLDLAVETPDGATARAWQAWITSRTSLQEDPDGELRPRAALPDPDRSITLGRPLVVDVEALVPQGGVLSVRGACVGTDERVVAMGQRLGTRRWADQLRINHGGESPLGRGLASSVGLDAWRDTPERWRRALLDREWQRLGALSEPDGGDTPTVRIYQRDEQAGLVDSSARGTLVPPGGALAWNLEGPAVFSGDWTTADGVPTRTTGARARAVLADGTVQDLGVLTGTSFGPWSFGETVASVQIALDPASPITLVRAYVRRAGHDPVWGVPPHIAISEDTYRVSPDLRTVELARLTESPVRFAVADRAATRISFRVPLPPTSLTGFAAPAPGAPAEVTLRGLDAQNNVVETWQIPLTPVAEPFERYALVDTPAVAAVGTTDPVIFVPLPNVVAVEMTSPTPVDVGLRVTEIGWDDPVPQREYGLPEFAPVDTVWVPHEQDPWVAEYPQDYDRLSAEGRIVRVDGQVRLEPDGTLFAAADDDEDGEPAAAATPVAKPSPWKWHPYTLPGGHDLIALPGRRAARGPGAYARLGSAEAAVHVSADGRLPVTYRVPGDAVGRDVTFRINGEPFVRTLAAAADVLRIGPLAPGAATLSVDAEGMFLAPAERAGDWRLRRVWRATAGQRFSIPVPAGQRAIAISAWLSRGDQAGIRWRVVPGTARDPGLYRKLTKLSGSNGLIIGGGKIGTPLSMDRPSLYASTPAVVTLGSDLPPRSRLEVEVLGMRAPTWIHVSTSWETPGARNEETNWRKGPAR